MQMCLCGSIRRSPETDMSHELVWVVAPSCGSSDYWPCWLGMMETFVQEHLECSMLAIPFIEVPKVHFQVHGYPCLQTTVDTGNHANPSFHLSAFEHISTFALRESFNAIHPFDKVVSSSVIVLCFFCSLCPQNKGGDGVTVQHVGFLATICPCH